MSLCSEYTKKTKIKDTLGFSTHVSLVGLQWVIESTVGIKELKQQDVCGTIIWSMIWVYGIIVNLKFHRRHQEGVTVKLLKLSQPRLHYSGNLRFEICVLKATSSCLMCFSKGYSLFHLCPSAIPQVLADF